VGAFHRVRPRHILGEQGKDAFHVASVESLVQLKNHLFVTISSRSPGRRERLGRKDSVHRRNQQELEVGAVADRVKVHVSDDQQDVGEAVGECQSQLLDGTVGECQSLGALGGGQLLLRFARSATTAK
jgi:hypothetical protein